MVHPTGGPDGHLGRARVRLISVADLLQQGADARPALPGHADMGAHTCGPIARARACARHCGTPARAAAPRRAARRPCAVLTAARRADQLVCELPAVLADCDGLLPALQAGPSLGHQSELHAHPGPDPAALRVVQARRRPARTPPPLREAARCAAGDVMTGPAQYRHRVDQRRVRPLVDRTHGGRSHCRALPRPRGLQLPAAELLG
jgi:hypothetical protein